MLVKQFQYIEFGGARLMNAFNRRWIIWISDHYCVDTCRIGLHIEWHSSQKTNTKKNDQITLIDVRFVALQIFIQAAEMIDERRVFIQSCMTAFLLNSERQQIYLIMSALLLLSKQFQFKNAKIKRLY